MADLILHHYAGSPFSQKVRWILGYKRVAWDSVIVPVVMPKPDVVALTGGYRRTPFMQRGADIYCDTALMCRVIDTWYPQGALYPAAIAGLAETLAQWADSTLFWTAVPFTMQPAGIEHVLRGATPEMLKAFGADRAAMNPGMRRATLADGAAALRTYLARLEHMLRSGSAFLLGELPCIADFSAAQSIWFMRLAPPIAAMLDDYPGVQAWFARVDAFGQGTSTKMSAAQAIELAARGELAPVSFVPEPGLVATALVSVTPSDYAHDQVTGRLVGLGPQEVVIAREDERAGRVQVHFPRIGFQIKPQTP